MHKTTNWPTRILEVAWYLAMSLIVLALGGALATGIFVGLLRLMRILP